MINSMLSTQRGRRRRPIACAAAGRRLGCRRTSPSALCRRRSSRGRAAATLPSVAGRTVYDELIDENLRRSIHRAEVMRLRDAQPCVVLETQQALVRDREPQLRGYRCVVVDFARRLHSPSVPPKRPLLGHARAVTNRDASLARRCSICHLKKTTAAPPQYRPWREVAGVFYHWAQPSS